MKGSLAFEKAQHQAGLNSLAVAHDLLTTLSRGAETANLEALTNEVIDEVEPMLRFCAYSLQLDVSKGVGELVEEVMKKEESGKLVEGYGELAKELEKEGKSEKRESVELVWRGREIPVRSAELVGVVLKVQQAIKSLEADKDVGASGSTSTEKKGKGGRKDLMGARRMGTYDKALTTLGEAEDVARQLVEDNKVRLRQVRHNTSARRQCLTIFPTDRPLESPLRPLRSLFRSSPTRPLLHHLPTPLSPHKARSPPHLLHLIQTLYSRTKDPRERTRIRFEDRCEG